MDHPSNKQNEQCPNNKNQSNITIATIKCMLPNACNEWLLAKRPYNLMKTPPGPGKPSKTIYCKSQV